MDARAVRLKNKRSEDLSASRLREIIEYDAQSGSFTWKVRQGPRAKAGSIAGSQKGNGYIRVCVDEKAYTAHRLAWLWMNGRWPNLEIDHINGIRHDNRWCNLRLASRSQNEINKEVSRRSVTGVKGVSPYGQRFEAKTKYQGKLISIGIFDRIEEAKSAYQAVVEKIHGEFADLSKRETNI